MTPVRTDGPQPIATFAVVMPTRNRAEQAVDAIRRIQLLSGAPDQIVVVDDKSDDDTAVRLAELPGIDVVAGDGSGPASARNLGASRSKSDWLVFVDDDDEPHDNWMTTFRHLAAIRPDAVHLSVGFRRQVSSSTTTELPRPLGPAFGGVTANFIAGTFAVRAEVFRSVGGFGAGLRAMNFTDLALRVFGFVARTGAVTHHSGTTSITIFVASPDLRPARQAGALEAAWTHIWAEHGELLRRDPLFLADQHSALGVAWARSGDLSMARRHLLLAVRTRPNPERLARCALSSVSPIARRYWGTRG